MADNVAITPGSGATIATDDVGGAQYQRVKLDLGGDGAASPLVRGQQAKANSLPVALASDQDALTVNLGATDNAVLDAIQAAVEGTLAVDGSGVTQPISAAVLPLPTGAATAANQTTGNSALGAIQTAVEALDNAVAGSELQVDVVAALPNGDNPIGRVKITDGTTVANVVDLDTRNALAVAIVDGNGDQITSFGGGGGGSGTEYTEDAAAAANPVGGILIARRRDTPSGETTADGDNVALNATDKGELYVKHIDIVPVSAASLPLPTGASTAVKQPALGTAGSASADVISVQGVASMTPLQVAGPALHDGTVSGGPVLQGGYASAAAPSDVSGDGDAVRAWHLRNGAQATVVTAAGALIGGDATNGLDVDVTRLPNVTLAAGTNTNEVVGDAAHDAAAAGNPVLQGGYASAAAPSDVSGDGDAVRSWHLRNGAQAVVLTAAGALIGGDATVGLRVQAGQAAHDAAVAGNPLLNGFEARTTDGPAVTSGDAVRGLADTLGKQVILIGAVNDLQVSGRVNLTNTSSQDVLAQLASTRFVITSVLVTNASLTVGTKVSIRDGTTVKITGYAAPGGGGFALNAGGAPLFISTANTAVTAICGTTSSDTEVFVSGYRIGN